MKRSVAVVAIIMMLYIACLPLAGCAQSAPAGISNLIVPELQGATLEEAKARLAEAGFEAEVKQQESEQVAGSLLFTIPASGEELAEGERVLVVTSSGPRLVALPSVLGWAEDKAAQTLASLGITPHIEREYSNKYPAGDVCSMRPAADSQVAAGSAVTITISLGSAYVTCPRCGGSGSITTTSTCSTCGGSGVCYT